jgi:FkbM family methyltransferase
LKRLASETMGIIGRTGALDSRIPYDMQRVVPRLLYPGVLPPTPRPRRLRGLPVSILCNPHNPMHRVPYWFGVLFERPLDAFLRRVLRPGDNVIDVGANFGHISLLAAALVRPDGVVHAFEPHPFLADLVRGHAAAQPYAARVHVWQKALSDHSGAMTLRVNPGWPGASTVRPNPNKDSRTGTFVEEHEVEVVAADDLQLFLTSAGRVIVKIDVEGHEPAVIAGMTKLLARTDAVILEVTPAWIGGASGVASLLDDLGKLGFEPWGMDSLLEDRLRRSSLAALLERDQTNLLFARPSLIAAYFPGR